MSAATIRAIAATAAILPVAINDSLPCSDVEELHLLTRIVAAQEAGYPGFAGALADLLKEHRHPQATLSA